MAPVLVIAGTHSGVGKTTITAGLIAALRDRSLTVQPFKVGPDYIDPSHHTRAAGRPCRNLDTWMMGPERTRALFVHASRDADLALVEGVMGVYDGFGYDDQTGSTAEVAKLFGAPVVLILDASKMARSAAALAVGYQRFDPELPLVGFIINRVGSADHGIGVAAAVERATGLPVLGWVGRDDRLKVPERHLGLVPAAEADVPGFEEAGDLVTRRLDLDRLLALVREGRVLSEDAPGLSRGGLTLASTPVPPPSLPGMPRACPGEGSRSPDAPGLPRGELPLVSTAGARSQRETPPGKRGASEEERLGSRGRNQRETPPDKRGASRGAAPPPVIAVARDEAFHFTYPENLELLQHAGAELAFFSPLRDEVLPRGTAGVLLSGGFPEVHAARLSANGRMRQALRQAHQRGVPIYAECGGLMYLTESIVDLDGRVYPMIGLLPGRSVMSARLTLGYRLARAADTSWLLEQEETVRGHEFHYSVWEDRPADLPPAFFVRPPPGKPLCPPAEGAVLGKLWASYIHLHFWAKPELAGRFVAACAGREQAGP
jgi:cobyrinic acid a,c-diamide synthase